MNSEPHSSILSPNSTIGVLGGGQLGRMLALEARRMGYRILTWTGVDGEIGPAAMADEAIAKSFDDEAAFVAFVESVAAATVEFENIPRILLEQVADRMPLMPSAEAVAICQHREREKLFLEKKGFPCADFRIVDDAASLREGLDEIGSDTILKTAEFGYDGKGQRVTRPNEDAETVWAEFDTPRAVLEEKIALASELSVLVVRDGAGNCRSYDPAENFHRNHILDLSIVPARQPEALLAEAREVAIGVAEALEYTGVMAVEFFVDTSGRLLVNEIAPRPHNSGHHTLDACECSQFEQQLRVVAGLPIGGTGLLRPVVMWNLLGDLWPAPTQFPDWSPILETPGARLHLYGKAEARPGRKMGHATFLAETVEEVLAQVAKARVAFGLPTPE
ncbi:MAG: 5-(carboxyamino)imidazole ribonucleotide synthase [Verrucomicrobiae bacterium]|nr:5-(carboxyamino)imidazole ribonucleotide synthase [Verrucomicrobiae bacterium]